MTAMSLHSLPACNMLHVLRRNRKMAIVMSILMIISIPLTLGSIMLQHYHDKYNYEPRPFPDCSLYMLIGFVCLSIILFMGMICAICSFAETHNKAQVDMIYALPLTGSQRFVSDYLGGLCMYTLPALIGILLGWITMFIEGWLIHKAMEGQSALFHFIEVESTLSVCAEFARIYAMVSAGILFLMLFYYTLCALITICCGTLFESIYTNVLLNVLIPGTAAAIIIAICRDGIFSFDYLWQIIGYISPIGGGFLLAYQVSQSEIDYSADSWFSICGSEVLRNSAGSAMMYFRWILCIVILTALLFAAARKLYIRRKAECVGQTFVYGGIYRVMITLLLMIILCIGAFSSIGAPLLIAAIVYFVGEVIRKRGFKRFAVSVVTFVLTVSCTVGFYMLVINTGFFGRERYVPNESAVRSVEVSGYLPTGYELEFNNRETVSQIIAFHKQIVQRMKEYPYGTRDINEKLSSEYPYVLVYDNNYDYNNSELNNAYSFYDYPKGIASHDEESAYNLRKRHAYSMNVMSSGSINISLTYHMVSGAVVHRDLRVSADEAYEMETILRNTELCRKSMVELLRNMFYPINGVSSPITIHWNYSRQVFSNTSKRMDSLCKAYEHDLKKMPLEACMTAPVCCSFESRYNSGLNSGLKVYEGFTETIGLLEKWGFEKFNVPERYDFIDQENMMNEQATNQDLLDIRIFAPDQWMTKSLKYPNSSIASDDYIYVKSKSCAYSDQIMLFESVSLKRSHPELYALLDAAQEQYVSEQPCYCLCVNGKKYIVPPEKSDLAEAVIQKGNHYKSSNT